MFDDELKSESIKPNSAVIVTDKKIHLFDSMFEHRLVTITGLTIRSVTIIDSSYLYIMKSRCTHVTAYFADPEDDYEMKDP